MKIYIIYLVLFGFLSCFPIQQPTCQQNQFFNTNTILCENCESFQQKDEKFIYQCKCQSGYKFVDFLQKDFKQNCQVCPLNHLPSSDGLQCLLCPTTNTDGVAVASPGPNVQGSECKCNSGEVIEENYIKGVLTKQCVVCATDAYRGTSVGPCVKCPEGQKYNTQSGIPYKCECDTQSGYEKSGDGCVKSSQKIAGFSKSQAIQINYSVWPGTFSSSTIAYFYDYVSIGCTLFKNPQNCESLANLCVLQLYYRLSTVCSLYYQKSTAVGTNVNDIAGWWANFPFLYYESPASQVMMNKQLDQVTSFQSSSQNLLKYKLRSFDVYGNYLGIKDLTDEFMLCKYTTQDNKQQKSYGTEFKSYCVKNVDEYFKQVTTYFYELYIQDDATSSLVNIPILITNYKDTTNSFPNQGEQEGWKFVNRFFVVDSISGIQDSGQQNGDKFLAKDLPKVIRVASNIQLRVTMNPDSRNKILVPYLKITYTDVKQSQVGTLQEINLNYNVTYDFDTSSFWTSISSLFIVCNVFIVGIFAILRIYIWTERNPKVIWNEKSDEKFSEDKYYVTFLYQSIMIFIQTWGEIIFFMLFFVTMYIFTFFKGQANVYLVMPPYDITYDNNYAPFHSVVITICIFRVITLLHLVYSQYQTDIFILDWENPISKGEQQESSVSVWRQLFLANELNELQNFRQVSLEFTLIFFAYLMIGEKWENLGAATPFMTLDVESIPQNIVLKYFVSTILILCIGGIQYILRQVVIIWVPTIYQDFTDLCTVTNCSIFFFDEALHGYYIHGNIPKGVAEGNLTHLNQCLAEEAQGGVKSRGLIMNDQVQSFEIFAPKIFRIEYQGLFNNPLIEEMKKALNSKSSKKGSQESQSFLGKALPNNINYLTLENKKKDLAYMLKNYIEHFKTVQTGIIEQNYIKKLLNYPPFSIDDVDTYPLMIKDPDFSFQKLFLGGHEFSLLITLSALFNGFDLQVQNTISSVILTYITHQAIFYLRQELVKKNLSRKTMIDENFLN